MLSKFNLLILFYIKKNTEALYRRISTGQSKMADQQEDGLKTIRSGYRLMSPTEAGREAQKREVFRRMVREATSTQTCQDE